MGQRRLAHARQVLDQQVAARQQAGERELDLGLLADHDGADLAGHRLDALQAHVSLVPGSGSRRRFVEVRPSVIEGEGVSA